MRKNPHAKTEEDCEACAIILNEREKVTVNSRFIARAKLIR